MVIVCVMGYLARYLVRYLAIDIDSVFPYAYTSYVMLSITAFLTGLALFFSYVRQPLKTVGLSGESWDSLSVPGVGWALVAVLISSILFGLASVLQPSAPNRMESSFILRSYSYFFLLQARWLSAPDWMPPGRGGVLDPSRCNRGSPLPRAPLWFVTKTDSSSAGTVVNGNGLYDVP